MLLAIDTSTEMASLALVEDKQLLSESTWFSGQNHTQQLLPRLQYMLEKSGKDTKSIIGIVIARGPGSFNGLRVGLSTAKGLAFSLNVPLVGISTLEVSAYQHAASRLPICAIHNAGRSEVAVALFQMKRKKWQKLATEHITTLDAVLIETKTKTLFCGEYVPAIEERLRTIGSRAFIPSAASMPRRAFFLAELGQSKIDAGELDAAATLQPLYLRRPPITERKCQ